MKKVLLAIILIFFAFIIFIIVKNPFVSKTKQSINSDNNQDQALNNNQPAQNINISQNLNAGNTNTANVNVSNASDFQPPLDRSEERVTKKPFGIYITRANSPIQPERFTGYHTGADFEVFPEELIIDVPVKAVCAVQLKVKERASGYGGVAVQSCVINNEPVTIIYGHLKLSSITKKAGENLSAGETIGILGADKSADTDNERKHLHLGIHKGTATNIKGYVSAEPGLIDWIDPCLYVCHN